MLTSNAPFFASILGKFIIVFLVNPITWYFAPDFGRYPLLLLISTYIIRIHQVSGAKIAGHTKKASWVYRHISYIWRLVGCIRTTIFEIMDRHSVLWTTTSRHKKRVDTLLLPHQNHHHRVIYESKKCRCLQLFYAPLTTFPTTTTFSPVICHFPLFITPTTILAW